MRLQRQIVGLLAGIMAAAGLIVVRPLAGPAGPALAAVVSQPHTIAAGGSHSLVVKTDGTLWGFGSNYDGELGAATNSGSLAPNPTPTLVMPGVAQVAAGRHHSLVLRVDGTLWSFGANGSGELGTLANSGTLITLI